VLGHGIGGIRVVRSDMSNALHREFLLTIHGPTC
jgi:hypothetical protein